MFEKFQESLSGTDSYYYLTISVLVIIFLYMMYELFYVRAYHFYQDRMSEGFVSNIKEDDKIARVDIAEKVLGNLKKENTKMDEYIQKGSYKDIYEDIVYELEDLADKNILGLISNMKEFKGHKAYMIMKQVNDLHTFKQALNGVLNTITDGEQKSSGMFS